MYPILFEFAGFTLYTQIVCIFFAFLTGLWLAIREGDRLGISRLDLTDAVLWGFLCAIPGARLLFLLLSWQTTTWTFSSICVLGAEDGGFSFHGGLLAAGLAGWLTARVHQLCVWQLADALAPGLAVAVFSMRLGCLLNGCDYGVAATVPWGIVLHGANRHPIQLYEGVGNLGLLPVLLFVNARPHRSGQTGLLYLMLSGLIRVGVDFYREEAERLWQLLTIPQILAAAIAAAAGLMLYVLMKYPSK